MLRVTSERLAALDPATLTSFGHLLESFVVGEQFQQLSWADGLFGIGHWRTHDGDEVDLVVEDESGRVAALEVKAAGHVRPQGPAGLAHAPRRTR